MIINILKVIFLAYMVTFCQSSLSNLVSIGSITPNFGTIIILLLLLKKDFQIVLPLVLMIGLLIDALNPELLGLGTAIRFSIAAVIYTLKDKIEIERFLVRFYLLLGAEIVFQLFYQVLSNKFDISILASLYLETSIPTLLYTVILGIIVLFISDLKINLEVKKRPGGTTSI